MGNKTHLLMGNSKNLLRKKDTGEENMAYGRYLASAEQLKECKLKLHRKKENSK
jgi:hypothetical protein